MTSKQNSGSGAREGSLDAPQRHSLNWQDPSFYDEADLTKELERVFDICHGCRRCFSLCNSFPTLFDAIDESDTMELDGVDKKVYWDVVDHCYLCDMCFMTKCPYVPPHEWNIDFPHLMLRAKAVKFKKGEVKTRDKILSSTDTVGKLAGIPVVVNVVNAVNKTSTGRKLLEKALGVHTGAHLPNYKSRNVQQSVTLNRALEPKQGSASSGKVALFATCYCNYIEPHLGDDLVKVFEHNGIPVVFAEKERCCGMPKLELGDLAAVAKAKEINVPALARLVDQGYDLVAPVPSCALMFKQELPLMFPEDSEVRKVADAMYDPFEYLMARHKDGLLNTEFKNPLGKIAYHVACHLRVQNIGMKTRDLLTMVPETEVHAIERCSGHDGTYAVKQEYHDIAMKICKPVVNRVKQAEVDYYASDCPMAGHHIANGMGDGSDAVHPMTLLRQAYGI